MPSTKKEMIYHEKVHMPKPPLGVEIIHLHRQAYQSGCEFHWHEQLEFYFIYQGGLSLICNGKQDWLYRHDIGFVNWCQPHRGSKFLNDTKYYVIKIDLCLLEDCFSEKYNMPYTSILIDISKNLPIFIKNDDTLVHYFKTLIQETTDKKMGYEMVVKSMTQLIVSHILRLAHGHIDYNKNAGVEQNVLQHIHYILQYISENYTNYITLDDLSSNLGLSKAYMCRVFKRHTQQTILTYINELKCSRAASLLLNGVPLVDVCEEVGFGDYNYFSRLFKKVYGLSPKNYKSLRH